MKVTRGGSPAPLSKATTTLYNLRRFSFGRAVDGQGSTIEVMLGA